jgi:hypothetical protein
MVENTSVDIFGNCLCAYKIEAGYVYLLLFRVIVQVTASLSLYLIFYECMDQRTDVNHLRAAVPTV